MNKERLVAFSDGVFAVIITIMVLELKAPAEASIAALNEVFQTFAAYVLSFIYVAVYWNNHHHLFHIARRIDGKVMWANLNLLFWLSLIPFATRWLDLHGTASVPVAFYGVSLLAPAMSYFLLQTLLVRLHGKESPLGQAFRKDFKGPLSLVLYLIAIPSAFRMPTLSLAIYFMVAAIWFIPDRRIEAVLELQDE